MLSTPIRTSISRPIAGGDPKGCHIVGNKAISGLNVGLYEDNGKKMDATILGPDDFDIFALSCCGFGGVLLTCICCFSSVSV